MNTKLLRQQILDLAIRGKLVKQDPNDEPASVLLERIRAEKEQLIQQGKIKKTKASATTDTPHYQNTPFDIPTSWQWVRLGEIAYIASGSTPNKSAFVDKGVPYLKMYNLRNQEIDFNYKPQYIKEEIHKGQMQRSQTEIGDLIMNIVGPPLGKLAIIPPSLPQCNFNQAAVLIRPHIYKTTIVNFLYYYLSEMSEIKSIQTRGNAGQDNISLTQCQNMRIPLPPLAEQRRIVAEVEKWFALIDDLETNKQDLQAAIRQVRAKVLDLAIHGKLVPQDPTDEPAIDLLRRINPHFTPSDTSHYQNVPFDIPASWEWVLHNDIINLVGGSQPPKSKFSSENREGYIRLYQIRDYGTTPVPVYIPLDLAQKKTNKGDILLARYGGSLGKVFRAEYGAYNVAMTKVVVKYAGLLDMDFTYIYYLAPIYQHKLKTISRTAQVGFNEVDFADLYFPLPPLTEQQRIVSEIDRVFAVLDTIENNIR